MSSAKQWSTAWAGVCNMPRRELSKKVRLRTLWGSLNAFDSKKLWSSSLLPSLWNNLLGKKNAVGTETRKTVSVGIVLPDKTPQLRMAHAESGCRKFGENGRVQMGQVVILWRIHLSSQFWTCDTSTQQSLVWERSRWLSHKSCLYHTNHNRQVFVINNVLHFRNDETSGLLVVEFRRLTRSHSIKSICDTVVLTNPNRVHDS